ncbi:MAG TPA: sigma-54 dependent transcriptional regulator [Bryobacteraceae bacterium]|nr:sigma-54 dependent transcriptional regulator [Bryobacteraceae bacterium]
MEMRVFWIPSSLNRDGARPSGWPTLPIIQSTGALPAHAAAAIAEIRCEADAGRAAAFLESMPRSASLWIYDPAASVESSVAWIKCGAAHVITNPDDPLCLDFFENQSTESAPAIGSMVGESHAMREVQAAIQMVAGRHCSVLIQGETGTGKEVVAREIHAAGGRSRGPWVAVNCTAIPEPLLEAELFGYHKGAFTGAVQSRAGKFEAANNGTIFLDEIGDMPIGLQARLLRVLQEREIERLGGNERVRLNIRVVAATNVDLAERVRQGLFRQDLFYRLNVFEIRLPALRERPGDIAPLARHFVRKVCAAERLPLKTLDRSALDRLEARSWPGNVRELENTIETAVILSGDRPVIFASDLRFIRAAAPEPAPAAIPLPPDGMDYQRALDDFEAGLLRQALTRVRGNKTAAAGLLGLKRTTLAAKMKALESRFPLVAA